MSLTSIVQWPYALCPASGLVHCILITSLVSLLVPLFHHLFLLPFLLWPVPVLHPGLHLPHATSLLNFLPYPSSLLCYWSAYGTSYFCI
jgi:hypothetical protein